MAQAMNDNKGPNIVAAAVCVIVIQVIVVALRFWSRALSTGTHFWWDDWMVLAALPCSLVLCAVNLSFVHVGFGRHLSQILASGTTARQVYIMVFASHIPYNTGITLVKMSVLFFYARLFRDSRVFRTCLWATGALVVGWWIVFDVITICACIPPRKQWDTDIQGHCMTPLSAFKSQTALNVLIDVIILVLPLPILWKLHTTLRRKLILTGAFVVGYCVVIVSIVRLVTTVAVERSGHGDFTWNSVTTTLLVIVETPLAIVSVCMPSIFHLVKRGFYNSMPGLFSTENPSKPIGGKLGEHVGGLGNPVDSEVAHVQRLIDNGLRTSQQRLFSDTTATQALDTMSEDVPLEDMHVRNRVEGQDVRRTGDLHDEVYNAV